MAVLAEQRRQWWQCVVDGQFVGSAMKAGMAAADATTTVLPSRAVTLGTKTPEATAMAGAQITTNNQLKERWK